MSLFPRFIQQEMRPLMRLFEDPFFYQPQTISPRLTRAFQPSFDVHETKDAYELSGELPGINDKSKLDIEFVDAQTLVVKGKIERNRRYGPSGEEVSEVAAATEESPSPAQKPPKPTVEDEGAEASESAVAKTDASQEVTKSTKQNNGPKVWLSERMSGEFQRSFSFPATIDQDAVKASLKDGILSIVVPKRELKGARKINVE